MEIYRAHSSSNPAHVRVSPLKPRVSMCICMSNNPPVQGTPYFALTYVMGVPKNLEIICNCSQVFWGWRFFAGALLLARMHAQFLCPVCFAAG